MLLSTAVKNVKPDGKLLRISNNENIEGNNCGLFEPSVTAFAEGAEKNQDKTAGNQNDNRTGFFVQV
jgi:hypothetical protein